MSGWLVRLFVGLTCLIPSRSVAQYWLGERSFIQCDEDTRALEASFCSNACLQCDLDGFSYQNRNRVVSAYVGDTCFTGVGEYIAFVAMSEFIALELEIDNCHHFLGSSDGELEDYAFFVILDIDPRKCGIDSVAPYPSRVLTPCEASRSDEGEVQRIWGGERRLFRNTVPLAVGKVYYLQVGNTAGVRCDNTIRVVAGSTAVPEVVSSDFTASRSPCLGATVTYRPDTVLPATQYLFLLDGDTLASTEDGVDITWRSLGTSELCLEVRNHCSEPLRTCQNIEVIPPARRDTTIYLCADSCVVLIDGRSVCQPGIYQSTTTDAAGCPLAVESQIFWAPQDTSRLTVNLCSGDTLEYESATYFAAGTYFSSFTNKLGCDSVVQLDVFIQSCPFPTTVAAVGVDCSGGSSGQIKISALGGAPPYRYQINQLGGVLSWEGNIAGRNEEITIGGVREGTYLIRLVDAFGSVGYANARVAGPPPLSLSARAVDYGGYGVSCWTLADGGVVLSARGGVAPYSYRKLDGSSYSSQTVFDSLSAGLLNFGVLDANGCTTERSLRISSPPPLSTTFAVKNEDCGAVGSGRLNALNVAGGVTPYRASIQSAAGVDVENLVNVGLSAGRYFLTITDGNGCAVDTAFSIARPAVDSVRIVPTASVIFTGEEMSATARSSPSARIRWTTNPPVLICDTCRTISLRPTSDITLRVASVSEDGCRTTDSLTVTVAADHSVYVPNVFSPNGDGINDRWYPHCGRAVTRLVRCTIYDRWGREVYRTSDVAFSAIASQGWDGSSNRGKPAQTGVYTYILTVEFTDGIERDYSGTITLLKS